jgi:hypothetical protein
MYAWPHGTDPASSVVEVQSVGVMSSPVFGSKKSRNGVVGSPHAELEALTQICPAAQHAEPQACPWAQHAPLTNVSLGEQHEPSLATGPRQQFPFEHVPWQHCPLQMFPFVQQTPTESSVPSQQAPFASTWPAGQHCPPALATWPVGQQPQISVCAVPVFTQTVPEAHAARPNPQHVVPGSKQPTSVASPQATGCSGGQQTPRS